MSNNKTLTFSVFYCLGLIVYTFTTLFISIYYDHTKLFFISSIETYLQLFLFHKIFLKIKYNNDQDNVKPEQTS